MNKFFNSIDDMMSYIAAAEIQDIRDDEVVHAVWNALETTAYFESLTNVAKEDNMTNAELQEILKQYPDNALISVECCNPRKLVYDEKNNLIRID